MLSSNIVAVFFFRIQKAPTSQAIPYSSEFNSAAIVTFDWSTSCKCILCRYTSYGRRILKATHGRSELCLFATRSMIHVVHLAWQ